MGSRFARGLVPVMTLAVASLLLSGCEIFSHPQNTFNPAGEVAEGQKSDFLLVTWIALPIMILVLAACVAIPIMFRRKKGDPGLPKQIHGNTALELTWTIIPVFLLAIIAVPTVAGIRDLGREPSAEALEVRVTAEQFRWTFEYPEIKADGEMIESLPLEDDPFTEVLRIPVDREIALRLYSIDVNHSFWVPKLAGKTDVINNHPNKMWLRADRTGTFEGQCAEFCGLQHSEMRLRVIVLSQPEWDQWLADQSAVETPGGAGAPPGPDDVPTEVPPPPPPPGAIILDDNVVHVEGQDGDNPTINVPSGETIAIVNEGSALHNLQVSPYESDLCSPDDPSPCSDPPRINGGDEGTITFDVPPGTYDYRCDFHPVEMAGTVVVGPPEPGGGSGGAPGDDAGSAGSGEENDPAGE